MDASLLETSTLLMNPYVVGRPLTGASAALYVGREEIFDWFDENLSGMGQPNALMLYGRRRIGKTSTLYQLVEGERGRFLREDRPRRLIPAYIDLQRYAGRPTDEWLRRLARDICRRVETSNRDSSAPDAAVPGETAYATFDRSLDRLEDALPDDSLILLAVDEFEQIRDGIERGVLAPEALPFIRSQIQHRTNIAFLLCGSASLLDPFWGPIADLTARFEIGPLDFEQIDTLVRRPLEGMLEYEDAAVEIIRRATTGHPFLIQSICHRLVSQANRRHSREPIGPEEVVRVIAQMKSEGYGNDAGLEVTAVTGLGEMEL